jgi:hypothetical protein
VRQQPDLTLSTDVTGWRGSVRIVAAIRRLADAYNAGATRAVLRVVEQSEQPTVTVAAGGEGTPYLTATLEDTLICVRARDALGTPHATECRLRSDCGDDATAAYRPAELDAASLTLQIVMVETISAVPGSQIKLSVLGRRQRSRHSHRAVGLRRQLSLRRV